MQHFHVSRRASATLAAGLAFASIVALSTYRHYYAPVPVAVVPQEQTQQVSNALARLGGVHFVECNHESSGQWTVLVRPAEVVQARRALAGDAQMRGYMMPRG